MPSSVDPSPNLSLIARLLGIIRSPRHTFQRLVVEPRWADMLVLTFAVTAAVRIGLMSTEVGRQALTDQWVRRAEAFGQNVTDDVFATFERLGDHAVEVAALTSAASVIALAFVLAGALVLVFGRRPLGSDPIQGSDPSSRTRGSAYRRALAVVVHANVILMIRDVVAAPVNYLRESIAGPITLGTFFPMLDEGSTAARFLSLMDVFIVWWLIVLAIGTAALYGRPARSLATAYLAAYVAFAIGMAAAMAVSGGVV